MGLVALEGMHFYAKHGYYAHEKNIGARYTVDIYIKTNLRPAGRSDELEQTINYEAVYKEVQTIMSTSVNLIEHVALQIIEVISEKHPSIDHLKVRVTKNNPPIQGDVDRTFVEMESPK